MYVNITYSTNCTDHSCKRTAKGEFYIGNASSTNSGKECDMWQPHMSPDVWLWQFLDDSTPAASNLCRNPDGKPLGPWCFLKDGGESWEYCNVPGCPGSELCNPTKEFECVNGGCVPCESQCDGQDHCGDNSDELLCGEQSCMLRI